MYIYIALGFLLMCSCTILQGFLKKEKIWKALVISLNTLIFGVLGAFLLYLIESGKFGGISFYGSIILIPIFSIPLKFILKIDYRKVMDFVAPQVCLMLFVMKINCLVSGCCGGIVCTIGNSRFIFPSQIVESITSLIFAIILIIFDVKKILLEKHFPIYFITYGIFRFGINFLREGTTPFVGILPAGQFWSILVFAAGLIWLVLDIFVLKKKEKKDNEI